MLILGGVCFMTRLSNCSHEKGTSMAYNIHLYVVNGWYGIISCLHKSLFNLSLVPHTLLKFNITPNIWWKEDYFPFWMADSQWLSWIVQGVYLWCFLQPLATICFKMAISLHEWYLWNVKRVTISQFATKINPSISSIVLYGRFM